VNLDVQPGFGQFMRTAGRHRLLSAREEADLGRRVAAGAEARAQLDRGTDDQDGRLETIVRSGDEARSSLIRHNIRLVVDYVKKYVPVLRQRSLEFEDLVQEGTLGLLRAAELFDPTKGYRFSTYATWWIRQSVERGIANRGDLIRIPVHVQEQVRQLRKLRARFEEAGVPVTPKKMAQASEMTVAQIEGLLAVEHRMTTSGFEETIGGSALRRADVIGDSAAQNEFDAVERADARATLLRTLDDRLSEREREVLVRRFGLNGDGREETLEEIGQELGLTRERIRQIQNGALEQLAGVSYLAALL
jgi:RNA polymerase sigma factor (sigma-70 family)